MKPNKDFFQSKIFILMLGFILLLIYFSPYLIKGNNSHIVIHDNLNQVNMLGIFDGKFNANFFSGSDAEDYTLPKTPEIFHLAHLKLDKFFFSFDYFWGFVFNELFYRLLSFIGFYLLLNSFIFKNELPRFFSLLLAFAWIALPFWPPGNISIAGIPLFLLAFIFLYQNRNLLISYLIIIIYSFYSNFFFVGVYLLFALIILNIYTICYLHFFQKKRINIHLVLGTIIFFALSIVTHYPVFYNLFILQIPTNRIAQSLAKYNLLNSLKKAAYIFINSNKLSHSFHAFIIFPFSLIVSAIILKCGQHRDKVIIFWFWLLQIVFPLVYAIFFYTPFLRLYQTAGLGFNFSRIYVLKTPVWYLLWAFCLISFYRLSKKKPIAKTIILLLIILQIGINLSHSTYKKNVGEPSFRKFMSERQFDTIASHLNKSRSEYRIGCIGFFPAVANYNGFKTVGSFSSYYPLKFKKQFRNIIEDEITSSKMLNNYFTKRGSALFLFDDKIGKKYYDQNFIKKNISEITCELNFPLLKQFGVKYLFSTARISNSKEVGLELIYISSEPEYYYRMYVYGI